MLSFSNKWYIFLKVQNLRIECDDQPDNNIFISPRVKTKLDPTDLAVHTHWKFIMCLLTMVLNGLDQPTPHFQLFQFTEMIWRSKYLLFHKNSRKYILLWWIFGQTKYTRDPVSPCTILASKLAQPWCGSFRSRNRHFRTLWAFFDRWVGIFHISELKQSNVNVRDPKRIQSTQSFFVPILFSLAFLQICSLFLIFLGSTVQFFKRDQKWI